MAGTDGKVLGEARFKDGSLSGHDISAVLPSATVAHLQRILALADEESVAIKLAHKLLFVRIALGTMMTQVVS